MYKIFLYNNHCVVRQNAYTPTTLCSIHFVTAINQEDEPEVKKKRGMQIALSPTCALHSMYAKQDLSFF